MTSSGAMPAGPRTDVPTQLSPAELREDVPSLPPGRPRLVWVDVAKAVAIVLVVAYHVSGRGASYLLPGADEWWTTFWLDASKILLPVRMPLFFLVSGILAVPALRRPWRDVVRPRVLTLLWPFAIWTVLHGIVYGFGFAWGLGDPWGSAQQEWRGLLFGGTAYWYLTVLVAFFLIARLLRGQPALLLLGAVTARFATGVIDEQLSGLLDPVAVMNIGRLAYFAMWFMIGAFGAEVVKTFARQRPWPVLLPTLVVLYGVIAYAVYGIGGASIQWGYALSLLGVGAMVLLAVQAARVPALARLSRWVASRTLAIYVVHPVLLNLILIVTRRDDGYAGIPGGSVITEMLFTPVLTVLLVAASVGLQELCERIGLGWLFRLPRLPQRASAARNAA